MPIQKRKLHQSLIAIGVGCLIVFTPSVSLAWGPEAHKIIAEIAWDELKPNAKRRMWDLFFPSQSYNEKMMEQTFVDASTWADDIKVNTSKFNQEHFIERPFPANGTPPEPNLITALKKNLELLETKSIDRDDRVKALKFIIHYVGDIHQPLHCATRTSAQYPEGDSGANRVRIMVPDSGGRLRDVSLHSYWDTGLDSFSGSRFTVSDTTKRLKGQYSNREERSSSIWRNYDGWSKESFKLAQDVAYPGIADGGRVSVAYRSKGIKTVDKQLAQAGYRLGNLLNAVRW